MTTIKLREHTPHLDQILALQFDHAGTILVVVGCLSDDGSEKTTSGNVFCKIWSTVAGRFVACIKLPFVEKRFRRVEITNQTLIISTDTDEHTYCLISYRLLSKERADTNPLDNLRKLKISEPFDRFHVLDVSQDQQVVLLQDYESEKHLQVVELRSGKVISRIDDALKKNIPSFLTEEDDTAELFGCIECACLSPDCSIIAGSGFDEYITIWSVNSGEVIEVLKAAHYGTRSRLEFIQWSNSSEISESDCDFIEYLTFTPDCKFLLACRKKGILDVWNFQEKRLEQQLILDSDIKVLAVDGSGWIAIACEDGSIFLSRTNQDWPAGERPAAMPVSIIDGPRLTSKATAISVDNLSNSVHLSMEHNSMIHFYSSGIVGSEPHPPVNEIIHFASGREARGGNRQINIKETDEAVCTTAKDFRYDINSMAMINDNTFACTGSTTHTAILDSKTGSLLAVIDGDKWIGSSSEWTDKTGFADKNYHYVNPRPGKALVRYDPVLDILAIATASKIHLWSFTDRELINILSMEDEIISLTFNGLNSKLIAGGTNGLIQSWYMPTSSRCTETKLNLEGRELSPISFLFSYESYVLCGTKFHSNDSKFALLNEGDLSELNTFNTAKTNCAALCYSPPTLLTAADDAIRFWRIQDGALLGTLLVNRTNEWILLASDDRFDGTMLHYLDSDQSQEQLSAARTKNLLAKLLGKQFDKAR
jgi:WD40 repeat protein